MTVENMVAEADESRMERQASTHDLGIGSKEMRVLISGTGVPSTTADNCSDPGSSLQAL